MQKKVTLLKNMCKCIFDQHNSNTKHNTIHNNTGRVQIQDHHIAQPITDAADATGLGLATRRLTLSYSNYYCYVTLMVKLYDCHL